jgi:hypothetical protein
MMHTGRSPDGGLLYPAMPFASYTKVTRADSDAIFAFMQSVPPVRSQNRPHDLKFPYNNRSLIIGWRTLFFTEGEYKPDQTKSDDWNRGAYLVQGLGHCTMCHTAINALGGSSESAAFEGASFRCKTGMRHRSHPTRKRAWGTGASRISPIISGPAFPIEAPFTAPWRTSSTTACNI